MGADERALDTRCLSGDALMGRQDDLVARARRGDDRAFEQIFEQHHRFVYRFLHSMLGDAGRAEELTQETMLSVWRHAKAFDRRQASVWTWVVTIARNKQIDHGRGVRRLSAAAWELREPDLPAAPPDGEQILRSKQSGEILYRAIGALAPEQQELLRVAFCEAKSHRDIAAEQGLPLGTVKSRIRLALARLRTSLPMGELR